jgi:hypothetical protein
MRASEFNAITTVLNNFITQSAEVSNACVVSGKVDLDRLTVGQVKDLSTKARSLQSKTDQFLKQDLYHIIGMGNLSASQSAALNKLVKEVTSHRSIIKTVAALPTLPNKVDVVATYKATTVGLQLSKQIF